MHACIVTTLLREQRAPYEDEKAVLQTTMASDTKPVPPVRPNLAYIWLVLMGSGAKFMRVVSEEAVADTRGVATRPASGARAPLLIEYSVSAAGTLFALVA